MYFLIISQIFSNFQNGYLIEIYVSDESTAGNGEKYKPSGFKRDYIYIYLSIFETI